MKFRKLIDLLLRRTPTAERWPVNRRPSVPLRQANDDWLRPGSPW